MMMMTMTSSFCTVISVTVAITLGYQEEIELDRKMAKMIIVSFLIAIIVEVCVAPLLKTYLAGKAEAIMSFFGLATFVVGVSIIINANIT